MKRSAFFILLLFRILPTYAGGFIYIQKTADMSKISANLKKIICISPIIAIYSTSNSHTFREIKPSFNQTIYNNLQSEASKNKIQMKLYTIENLTPQDADYFNNLLPLKEEILESNFNKENSFNNVRGFFRSGIHYRIFQEAPKISPEFSYLSALYGTPYFMVCTLHSEKGATIFTQVLVNVESSEIVYKEVKYVPHRLNRRNMPPVFYDSFNFLTKK